MDSDHDEAPWQPSTDAQALANLRSLVRVYLREELGHAAFVMQFGLQCLQHDVATPRPPAALVPPAGDAAWETKPVVTCMNCGHQTNNPSCDCAACTGDSGPRLYMDTDEDHPGYERYAEE